MSARQVSAGDKRRVTTVGGYRVHGPRIVCDELGKWQETFAMAGLRRTYVACADDNGGEDYWAMTERWMD